MPDVSDFALAEYTSLRDEIAAALNEARALERHAILATGAIWAWLLTNSAAVARWYVVGASLPAFITLLAGIRAYALKVSVDHLGSYLKDREQQWGETNTFGWEHWVQPKREGYLTQSAVAFWVLLLTFDVSAAVYVGVGR